MTERIFGIHIGDILQIFTYEGTKISTSSSNFHEVVQTERVPLNPDRDGLRFLAKYVGYESKGDKLKCQVLSQNPHFAYICSAEIYKADQSKITSRPDLIIPERLIRRFQILEPVYSSSILPLEEIVKEETS